MGAVGLVGACGGDDDDQEGSTGGTAGTGGNSTTGGTAGTGGNSTTGGTADPGGASTGGSGTETGGAAGAAVENPTACPAVTPTEGDDCSDLELSFNEECVYGDRVCTCPGFGPDADTWQCVTGATNACPETEPTTGDDCSDVDLGFSDACTYGDVACTCPGFGPDADTWQCGAACPEQQPTDGDECDVDTGTGPGAGCEYDTGAGGAGPGGGTVLCVCTDSEWSCFGGP